MYNFLMTENAKHSICGQTYCPSNFIDHDDMRILAIWRNETSSIEGLRPISAHRANS